MRRLNYLRPNVLAILIALSFALLTTSSVGAAANLTVDRGQFKKQVGDLFEQTIIDGVKQAEDAAKEYAKKWMQDVQYGIAKKIAGRIRNNPEAMKMIKDAQARGESARKAFHAALKEYGMEGAYNTALKEFKERKSKEIFDKLKAKYTSGMKRINNLGKIQEELEDAKDYKEYKKLLNKYGIKGEWVKKFGETEERLKKLKGKFDKKFGTHVSIFKTLYEGMEGKELGLEMKAVFSIMEEFGSKVPILGDFIEAYGQLGNELLNATLRLKKAFAKWDMGCVGDGTHDWLSKKSNPKNNSFIKVHKFKTFACPEGDIPNLYVDWQKPDKLFFWTGKGWLETGPGSGGVSALREILEMLSFADTVLDGVEVTVPAAFKLYDQTGNFKKLREEAEGLPKKIRDAAGDMISDFVAYGGPKPIILEYLKTKTGYEPEPFFDRVVMNPEKYSYLYIRGFARGKIGAYKKYRDMLAALEEVNLRVVRGRVKAPDSVKKIQLSLSSVSGGKELFHNKEVKGGQYVIFLDAPDSASLEYEVEAEGFPPEKVFIPSFKFEKITKDIEFSQEITVVFEGEAEAEFLVGKPVKAAAKVSGGEGPYTLEWSASTDHFETAKDEDESFEWEYTFPETGEHWIELYVTDKNGTRGEARMTVLILFAVNVELDKDVKEGNYMRVIGDITGGKAPFKISWKSDDGQTLEKDTERNKVWNLFKIPKEGLKWVELTVTDSNDVRIPSRIDLIMDSELTLELISSKKVLDLNEVADIQVKIAGGMPPYTISLETSDGKSRTLRPTAKTSLSFKKSFPEEGGHWLQLTVKDAAEEPAVAAAKAEFQVGQTPVPSKPKAKPPSKKARSEFEIAPSIPSVGIHENQLSSCYKNPSDSDSYACLSASKNWDDGSGPAFSGNVYYGSKDKTRRIHVISNGKTTDIYHITDKPKCCAVTNWFQNVNEDDYTISEYGYLGHLKSKEKRGKWERFYTFSGFMVIEEGEKNGKRYKTHFGVDGKELWYSGSRSVEPPKTTCSQAMASKTRLVSMFKNGINLREALSPCNYEIDNRKCDCRAIREIPYKKDYAVAVGKIMKNRTIIAHRYTCQPNENLDRAGFFKPFKVTRPFTGWVVTKDVKGRIKWEKAYAEGEVCLTRFYHRGGPKIGKVSRESYDDERFPR